MPIGSHRARAGHPGAELGLWELRVLLLQLYAVRVAGLQVLDEHLARKLVLAPRRNLEVDLEERVRVAVEDRGHAVFLQKLDILEPVDVLARRRRDEVDVLDERSVLLIREPPAG